MEKDKDRTPVARDLITRCRRCGLDLMHVVIVHNQEGIVERVKCKTCGSEHKYHPDKKKPPSRPVQKKRAVPKKENFAAVFEKLAEKTSGKTAIPYSISGSFQLEDVIDHKTFGTGIVSSISHQKMEVVFRDGPRILGCNR
jgi:ribosomal protein L37E